VNGDRRDKYGVPGIPSSKERTDAAFLIPPILPPFVANLLKLVNTVPKLKQKYNVEI
jgi:hypothetical protein